MSNLTLTRQTNKQQAVVLPSLDKKAIDTFLAANPSVNLKKFNFFKKGSLETLNWCGEDPTTLLPQLKALQRLVRLTDHLDTAQGLYEQGLHAAVQIAAIPEHKFLAQYAALFTPNGLSSEAQAKQVHKRALARKSKALLTYSAIVQHQSAHYKATRFNNLSAATDANYDNLPSYQDLFGDLDFCTCPDCRSIFSPAAYLVDLMRLQDNYISQNKDANPPAQLLQGRRPDLWNIPLDCEHTNTLVAKLQIVNQVLLQTLGKNATYQQLDTTNYPFNLPFNLPLTQIKLYLSQNQQSLASIWQTLLPSIEPNDPILARQSLELSPSQWNLYSTPEEKQENLALLYGLAQNQDPVGTLASADTFLAQTGLSYTQLQELIQEDLSDAEVQQGLNSNFFINLGTDQPIAIQTDKQGNDTLMNLALDRLDAINRFVRLAQALGWSFTDLDWALRTIGTIVNTSYNSVPIINDAALPYLAWIQTLRQQYTLSINQICALIGTVKDFGQKNGSAFFDQIFNSTYVPNPPKWKDDQGKYNLVWNVPEPGSTVLSSTQVQIQNTLSAALKISQDDLLLIANQILSTQGIIDAKLPLTLANLSVLYRLSQLPILTGLTIREAFIVLSLPGQPTGALQQLVGNSGAAAQNILLLLEQFAKWLQTSSFSVEQLQFILTGDSQDPTLQNQALGADKIANFLNELHTAIEPTLLSEKQFSKRLTTTLQSTFGTETPAIINLLWDDFQQIPYITEQGIITTQGATLTTDQLVQELKTLHIVPPGTDMPADFWDELAAFIVKALQNSYQLQQKTLTQQLAALYNVSPKLVHALEVWGGLTLGDLKSSQASQLSQENPYAAVPLLETFLPKLTAGWSKITVLQDQNQDIVTRLKVLQQYAILLTSLSISAAEAQSMVEDPAYFGINYNSGNTVTPLQQFTLKNIQTLYQFKQLIQSFQDTQNHLLDYFAIASTGTPDLPTIAQKLSQITQWNKSQVQVLIQQLWPSTSKGEIPVYATVAGISQVQAYFTLAQQLNIDVTTLLQLAQGLYSTTDYLTYQSLADALWGGLQKQYQAQPSTLSALEGKLDEAKRNALVNLVIYQLRNQNLPIATARDLYEYLLIDVEVSGSVQTSYVREAISAVQLYIYRCMNQLEAGVTIQPELYTWWPWLEYYRVWQANREVFLYPENYIEPELRVDKTPQFTQLENDLQQSNLTQALVDKAVKTYLDGFAEVANLQIVGSYLYANDANNPPNQQTLYLVGRTTTQPYTYYYRSATFSWETDNNNKTYKPVVWMPWVKVNLQIKSTCVSPVYAFGRLFLFWVETKPGPSDQDTTGKPTNKRFEATLYYSFYDFNQQWSAPQQLVDPITLPPSVNTQGAAEADVWQQVKLIFNSISPSPCIYWSWGQPGTSCFWLGVLDDQFEELVTIHPQQIEIDNINISSGTTPSVVWYQNKLYCFYQDGTSLLYVVLENGIWQEPKPLGSHQLSDAPRAAVCQDINEDEKQPYLYCLYPIPESTAGGYLFAQSISADGNNWNEVLSSIPTPSTIAPIVPVDFDHALYDFYNRDGQLYWVRNSGLGTDASQVLSITLSQNPSVVFYQGKLYCFYQDSDHSGKLRYAVCKREQEDSNTGYIWQTDSDLGKMIDATPMSGSPSAVVYQGNLYCFYQTQTGVGQLGYVMLDTDIENKSAVWQQSKWLLDVGMSGSPTFVVFQNQLYCFYQGRKVDGTGDGHIWYTPVIGTYINNLSLLGDRVFNFSGFATNQQNQLPTQVVPGLDLTWSIDVGPDGTQFLSIPVEGGSKNEIRLNSRVVPQLSQILLSQGMDAFLSLTTQKTPEINLDGTQTTTLDFAGANGLYYWELFFHMPFLIAHSLSTQQQFEVAKKWYEYIFDPTMSRQPFSFVDQNNPNDKYWQFLQLRAQYNPILQAELGEAWDQEVQADMVDPVQLAAYHNDPFDPHAIARLRPIGYQKTLVMHYIDNLLAWGDNLFRQYTGETLVEATMLYVMAYDLLGKQPVSLGPCPLPATETLSEIASNYQNNVGDIPEFLVLVEQSQPNIAVANVQDTPHNYIPGDYFGLPENDQFTAYWDKVQQRLYNIRHNLNIDGIYQQLPLFEPPINPMQLVGAVSAGEGVGQALAGSQVDVPYYRFSVVVAKAEAMTQTVIQLGQSLLSVLEKQDAEQLSLLYNTNQQNLLALTRTSKQDQLEAATQTVQSLQASLQNAQDRANYYGRLLNKGLNSGEQAQIALESTAIYLQTGAQVAKGVSIAGYLTPTIFGLADGGMQPGEAISQGAGILEGGANALSMSAGLASTVASYQRRAQDWQLQQNLAQDDINQIQYQIVGAQYQEHIASEEIRLLEKQVQQEQAVQGFLKNKFSRAQLYQWMVGKIAALYFQAYQLAYNLALQAEKAWQFERGNDQTFIHVSYWDDLHHGLVAGEALQLELQRMEKAYMDQDIRTFEIEKVISLAQLAPQALQDLKTKGSCTFELTEKDFDVDYPGHYCRQIKSVSVSLPALLGPYQNIHAMLTQTGNKTLLQPDDNGVKYLLGVQGVNQPSSSVLRMDMRANQQVALSQGLNDSGLFVLNFEDPRYLPFEGTGAVSSWQLEMPKAYNAISFDSITDVVVRLQYIALSGGSNFKKTVKANLGQFNGSQTLFMAQGYASAWYSFIQQGNPLVFSVAPSLFRPNLQNYTVTEIALVVVPTAAGMQVTQMPILTLTPGTAAAKDFNLQKDASTGVIAASASSLNIPVANPADWNLVIKSDTGGLMTAAHVGNMVISLGYTANFSNA